MANGTIQAVTEHTLVKTFTPLFLAGLMGIVGWLFATVMDVEKIAPYVTNLKIPFDEVEDQSSNNE